MGEQKDSELCRLLEWDSHHFGKRLAKVMQPHLSEDLVRRIFDWCAQKGVEGLYYLCPAGELSSARCALQAGFDLANIRVDMTMDMNRADRSALLPDGIRPAHDADMEVLKAVARSSHHDTRFYADSHFERSACDRLYEIWLEKSFRNTACAVWTADGEDHLPVGYVTCEIEESGVGRIGLVAVRESMRGRGWGKKLMLRAIRWFADAGCSSVRVATQAGNTGALTLYGSVGFVPVQIGLWFHKWF